MKEQSRRARLERRRLRRGAKALPRVLQWFNMIILPIPGAIPVIPGRVFHVKGWLSPKDADSHGEVVIAETFPRWQSQRAFGAKGPFIDRGHTLSRFGDANITYSFKGTPKPMWPMVPSLHTLRGLIEGDLSWSPNCCVVNTYEPSSGLYPHCDSQYIPQLGPDPVIVSVSFGTPRSFQFWSTTPAGKVDKSVAPVTVVLGHGDLVVMHGDCDSAYRHGIPEEPHLTGTRVSLTFRRHIT